MLYLFEITYFTSTSSIMIFNYEKLLIDTFWISNKATTNFIQFLISL